MSFRVRGLSPELFGPLFNLSDAELYRVGARRVFADDPNLPCRVSMAHAEAGEELLLVNFEHQLPTRPIVPPTQSTSAKSRHRRMTKSMKFRRCWRRVCWRCAHSTPNT